MIYFILFFKNNPLAIALGPISSIETPHGKLAWVMIWVLYLTGLLFSRTFVIRRGRFSRAGGALVEEASLIEDGDSIL